MFENYSFFKSSEGGIYSVAPRIIEAGFNLDEGHVAATQEEKENFIQRTMGQSRSQTKDELQLTALNLRDRGLSADGIKQLIGVDVQKFTKKDLARLEQLKLSTEVPEVEVSLVKSIVEPEAPKIVPIPHKTSLPEDIISRHNAKRLEKEAQRQEKMNI